MNHLGDREKRILDLVRRSGFATIEALAQQVDVTPQTIRRDINRLSKAGVLRRYHGGAGLPSSAENVAYSARQILCLDEKQRIARMVAERIPNQASLFINIGTTTEEIAKALMGHKGLRIITNNLNVANIVSGNPDFEVVVAGGLVRSRDRGIIGEAALDLIRQFKVDVGIIGIGGIEDDGTLLDFDYREVRVAQAIIENSRDIYLAADHTKFGRNAMTRQGDISQITALFTDRPPPLPIQEILEANAIACFIADGSDE
jgi:DeoR family transcriptional regulator, glycerol-3-phosphate regulon repressor